MCVQPLNARRQSRVYINLYSERSAPPSLWNVSAAKALPLDESSVDWSRVYRESHISSMQALITTAEGEPGCWSRVDGILV